MPLLMVCIIPASQVGDAQVDTPKQPPHSKPAAIDPPPDIVVTARVRGTVPGATSQYSERDITLFRALTVGELVDRLQRRNGGRPLAIIINGRRLADYSDILQIPPEALAALQILPPTRATAYGFSPASPVLNLILKERYSDMSADVGVRLPTEGGNQSLDTALRPVRISGDRRLNATLQTQASTALNAKSRLDLIDSNDILSPYRTLLPATRSLGGNVGWAMLVGSSSLTLTGSFDQKRSRQQSRFFKQVDDKNAPIVRGVEDLSTSFSAQGSATLSGITSGLSWSSELTGAHSQGRSYSQPSNRIALRHPIDPDFMSLPSIYAPINVSNRNSTLGLAVAGNASLLRLPAGPATASLRFSTTTTWLNTRSSPALLQRNVQNYSRIRASVELPLIESGMNIPIKLGSITASASGEINKVTAYATNSAYDASLTWQPTESISFMIGRATENTLPSITALHSPIVYSPGALISDPASGAIVSAIRVSGGNPLLLPTSQHTLSGTFTYNAQIKNIYLSTSSEYLINSIDQPLIVTAYPTEVFQKLFPARFQRAISGELALIDTRSFNAARQKKSILRVNVRVSGHSNSNSKIGGNRDNEISWELSLTDDWFIRDTLYPSYSGGTINLLRTPIDSAQGSSAHRLNVEGSGAYGPLGMRISANWRGGNQSSSLSSSNDTLITRNFLTADFEMSWTLKARGAHSKKTPMRMWLSVANLLNRRIVIMDQLGRIPIAYQPAFTDPLGRVVAIKISQQF